MSETSTHRTDMINRLIFILSLAGIVMAVYVLQSFLRDAPIVCLTDGCETVRNSPLSYPFGIPVPAFGLVGYSLIAILSFLKTTSHTLRTTLLPWITGIATGGVLFVSWFTYTEIFIIDAICTWCAISGVNMVVIAALSWWSIFPTYKRNKVSTTHNTIVYDTDYENDR